LRRDEDKSKLVRQIKFYIDKVKIKKVEILEGTPNVGKNNLSAKYVRAVNTSYLRIRYIAIG